VQFVSGFPLGRIAGIRLRVNWSVLVIVALVASTLGANGLPSAYPGHSAALYALLGIAGAAGFVLSILAHEVAHAIVARRNGIDVEDITLWLFGGVSRMSSNARTPGADFRIAGAGPLTSLILGVVFFGAAGLIRARADTIAVGVLGWLGVINVLLAVFNVLPGAPLDGGRLLRALLWRIWGDRYRAARTAARAGRGLGYLLAGLGLAEVLVGLGFQGIWLAAVGWILVGGAAVEERQNDMEQRLQRVTVREVMMPAPPVVPAWMTVDAFVDSVLLAHDVRAFPIADINGELLGLLPQSRVRELPRTQWATTRVGDIACPLTEVAVTIPDEPVTELLPRLAGCGDGHALVMDGGRLVGLVTPEGISRRAELEPPRAA
jgi:Zn-dependent protease/CBS domain-containing protein